MRGQIFSQFLRNNNSMKEFNKENFYKNFKELRTTRNLSQPAFASLLNTTKDVVSNIENKRSEPSLDLLLKICEEFDLTPNELFSD